MIPFASGKGGLECAAWTNGLGALFSYVDLEARVPKSHPLRVDPRAGERGAGRSGGGVFGALRPIGPAVDPAGEAAAGDAAAGVLFDPLGAAADGAAGIRPAVPLVRRGSGSTIAVWDHSVFSKNRDRLLEGDIAAKFLAAVLAQPRVKRLLSNDHFSVDGTLIEAWASMKSFKPKGRRKPGEQDGRAAFGRRRTRNGEADFHGEKRSNDTHASTTDPDARLYRKGAGKEAKLCFIGHALMENRNGLLVDACLTQADGHAERVAALHMIEPRADRPRRITLGADKGYDAEDFVNELRSMNVTPHVAQNTSGRSSAIDGRTTRHAGYALSQRIRKRIEEAFGWIKTVAGQEKTKFRGCDRVGFAFTFAAAAYNLVRLPKLLAAA